MGSFGQLAKYTPPQTTQIPKLPNLLAPSQTGRPQTTVQNGKAMVMVNGQWVPQSSAAGAAALGGGASGGGAVAGGAAGGGVAGPNLANFAQKDPKIEQTYQNYQNRIKALEAGEGKADPNLQFQIDAYKNQLSSDNTQHLIDQSAGAVRDNLAGAEQAADARKARSGGATGGAYGAAEGAAQRLQAKNAANIGLAQQARKDALVLGGQNVMSAPGQMALAKSNALNSFLLGSGSQANDAAQLALAQQGLGLQQWQAQTDANYKNALLGQNAQNSQQDLYLKLLSAGGYL